MTQLFDLQNDPKERVNLAETPEYAPQVEKLRQALLVQRNAYQDGTANRKSAPYSGGYKVQSVFWNEYAASVLKNKAD
jgi:hypothetical protein